MPVTLTPRPQPGDLITADWMGRLADAIVELQNSIAELNRRLAVLEAGAGRRLPQLVDLNGSKFDDFLTGLRVSDFTKIKDDGIRLEKAAEAFRKQREDLVLDDAVSATSELSPGEWLVVGAAAGIRPSKLPDVLGERYPTSASAVKSELGDQIFQLDGFTDLSKGRIGF